MRDQHHDDFGGLQRDLLATSVAIDRRGMLRLGAIRSGDRRAAPGGVRRHAGVRQRVQRRLRARTDDDDGWREWLYGDPDGGDLALSEADFVDKVR